MLIIIENIIILYIINIYIIICTIITYKHYIYNLCIYILILYIYAWYKYSLILHFIYNINIYLFYIFILKIGDICQIWHNLWHKSQTFQIHIGQYQNFWFEMQWVNVKGFLQRGLTWSCSCLIGCCVIIGWTKTTGKAKTPVMSLF